MAAVDVGVQHGWGFGAWSWDAWRGLMPVGFVLHAPDRGYFGQRVDMDPLRPQIVVAHSLGLHLLAPAWFAAAELVVVVSSFGSFHSRDTKQAWYSRRTVERMLVRLESEPEALLSDFYTRSCAPRVSSLAVSEPVCTERLRVDLELLQESEFEPERVAAESQVLFLHGSDDRIVPLERSEELHGRISGSTMSVLEGAGHMLPITHARECWREIERVWRRMRS